MKLSQRDSVVWSFNWRSFVGKIYFFHFYEDDTILYVFLKLKCLDYSLHLMFFKHLCEASKLYWMLTWKIYIYNSNTSLSSIHIMVLKLKLFSLQKYLGMALKKTCKTDLKLNETAWATSFSLTCVQSSDCCFLNHLTPLKRCHHIPKSQKLI